MKSIKVIFYRSSYLKKKKEKENWPLWNGHSSAWGLLSEKTFIFIPNLANRLDEKKKETFPLWNGHPPAWYRYMFQRCSLLSWKISYGFCNYNLK